MGLAGPASRVPSRPPRPSSTPCPDDVYVGIVTFDADVETALPPSQDREAAQSVIDDIPARPADAPERRRDPGGRRRPAPRASETSWCSRTAGTPARPLSPRSPRRSPTPTFGSTWSRWTRPVRRCAPLKAMSDAGGGSVISADADALEAGLRQARPQRSPGRSWSPPTVPDSVPGQEATVAVSAPIDGAQTYQQHLRRHPRRRDDAGPSLISRRRTSRRSRSPRTDDARRTRRARSRTADPAGRSHGGAPPGPASAEERILAYGGPTAGAWCQPSVTHRTRGGSGPRPGEGRGAARCCNRNRGLEERISHAPRGCRLGPQACRVVAAAQRDHHARRAGRACSSGRRDFILIVLGLFVGWLLPKLWLGRKRRAPAEGLQRAGWRTRCS